MVHFDPILIFIDFLLLYKTLFDYSESFKKRIAYLIVIIDKYVGENILIY